MNNGFQQMWAEIKNLWSYALIECYVRVIRTSVYQNSMKTELHVNFLTVHEENLVLS